MVKPKKEKRNFQENESKTKDKEGIEREGKVARTGITEVAKREWGEGERMERRTKGKAMGGEEEGGTGEEGKKKEGWKKKKRREKCRERKGKKKIERKKKEVKMKEG